MTDTVKPVLATLLLMGTCAVLLVEAYRLPFSQDWIPFHVASKLAGPGQWQFVYPTASATSLLDVPLEYRRVATESAQINGTPAFHSGNLTGFVSPPPAAHLLAWAEGLEWTTSQRIWRFALTAPVVIAFVVFAAMQVPAGPTAVLRWSMLCAAALPIVAYLVMTGQPTSWLVLAAFITAAAPGRIVEAIGATALTLGILTKATPILVLVGLWFAGRRSLALIAAVLTVAAVALSFPWTGIEAWTAFVDVARRIGSSVITEWNNVSLDATLGRLLLGVSNETMYAPPPMLTALSWLARIVLVVLAARVAIQVDAQPVRRVAAVWVGWLAATPLLWLHYLIVLLPFLGSSARRRPDAALWLIAGLSAMFVLRVLDIAYSWAGNLSSIMWIAAGLWLLSRGAWTPAISPARGSR